ncbi:carboxypeptidase Y [Coniochaeta sp. 2T2.1]|nr:carboxypeptidase Y [Coniochaeta sp. 2T2.1]
MAPSVRRLALWVPFLATGHAALLTSLPLDQLRTAPTLFNNDDLRSLSSDRISTQPVDFREQHQLKIEQNSTICDAGSRHWTGHVPLGRGRDMFYWYFESLVMPEEAPLVIWTNGGPGGSSMLGAFFEIGPCRISPDGKTTRLNEHSWTRHANILFIDQPIGVGLSATRDPSLWAMSLREGGMDVDKFLDVFLTDLFPELEGREIHFAGESFGGKYVPVYAAMTRRRFESVVLVDPYVDPALHSLGSWGHFCPLGESERREDRGGKITKGGLERYLNATACEAMEGAYSKCERARRACSDTYEEYVCRVAARECEDVSKWWMDEIGPGGRDPYDDRSVCDRGIDLCHDMGQDRTNVFFNLPHVKQALGLPEDFEYESISWGFSQAWSTLPDGIIPSTRELTALLDDKHTRVLVMQGNNDGVIPTESIKQIFDELLWHGHAKFSRASYEPWHHLNADGTTSSGEVKSYGNLTVVIMDEAGHMSPHDQADAGVQLLGMWLGTL